MHTYIHTYIHTCMHAYIYAYTHTHSLTNPHCPLISRAQVGDSSPPIIGFPGASSPETGIDILSKGNTTDVFFCGCVTRLNPKS